MKDVLRQDVTSGRDQRRRLGRFLDDPLMRPVSSVWITPVVAVNAGNTSSTASAASSSATPSTVGATLSEKTSSPFKRRKIPSTCGST